MKNRERAFYFVLLILQFVAVLYILNLNNKLIAENNAKRSFKDIRRSGTHFYSFRSVDGNMFQFTAYSGDWYLIATVSENCNKCLPFLKRFEADITDNRLMDNFKILGLTAGSTDKFTGFKNIEFHSLSAQDIYQFGETLPVLYLVNGRGDILYKGSVFQENYIGTVLDIYNRNSARKSTRIN